MLRRYRKTYIWIIVLLIIITGLYLYNLLIPMPGADDGANDIISQLAPDYKSWQKTIGYKPNEITEPIILGIQLLLGAGMLCFFIFKLKQSGKKS